MAFSVKLVASELLMCGLKSLPFVGTALEVVAGVRSRHEMLAHVDRLTAAEQKQTRMETGLRDLVKKEITAVLENLSRPNLDGPTLTQEIRNLQEIRAQGWEPTLFEGLLANSSHWQELHCNPQNYGRILSGPETVNRESIHVLIDADSTRVLELTPFAFSQLLAGQALGAPKATLLSAQDIWALPVEHLLEPKKGQIESTQQRQQTIKPQVVVQPKSQEPHFTNLIRMKFALIPAGNFLMGSPDSEENHQKNEEPQLNFRTLSWTDEQIQWRSTAAEKESGSP
jgi:formylglycine-generating enzyme required for sulfatase activity